MKLNRFNFLQVTKIMVLLLLFTPTNTSTIAGISLTEASLLTVMGMDATGNSI